MTMAAKLLDGDALAQGLRQKMSAQLAALGLRPRMTTVLVGENPASQAYLARKHQDCLEVGIDAQMLVLPEQISQTDLLAEIARLNDDPHVDGFFVQFPLPAHLDERVTAAAISPAKDIDGLHPQNLGALITGGAALPPCTPAAVMALLAHYKIPLAGKNVTLIGRGPLVGRALGLMLTAQGIDATLTIAHSHTPDLSAVLAGADVVISAAGQPDLIRAAQIKQGATVVGVGISYDKAGQMVSDIAEDVAGRAGAVTPRHGSIGAITRAMLQQNLITAACARRAQHG